MAVGDDKKDEKDPKDDIDDVDDPDLDDEDDDDEDDDDEFSDKTFNAKRARKTILEQRKSERDLRKQLSAHRKELKELKARSDSQGGDDGTKGKPVDEKLAREKAESDQRATRLEGELRKATVKSMSSETATKLGFRNPAKAYRLLDMDDVDFDEDGKPTNLRSLLREELRDNPELKRRRDDDEVDDDNDADGGRGRRRKPRETSMNDRIRAAVGR